MERQTSPVARGSYAATAPTLIIALKEGVFMLVTHRITDPAQPGVTQVIRRQAVLVLCYPSTHVKRSNI